jgi:hypothetical protein
MNLGDVSTRRERPRKAFEMSKGNYSKKLDFGESLIPEGKVYRRRGTDGNSWFWTTLKFLILGFILFIMVMLLIDGENW